MRKIVSIAASAMLMIALSGCLGNAGNSESAENAEPAPAGDEQPADSHDGHETDGQTSDNPDDPVSSGGGGGEDGSTGTADGDNPAKNRPETKTDTIGLEGTEESFEFKLHDEPALEFSTYIVNDLLVEGAASSGEGDSLTVVANFAGQKNEDARVHFFSPSEQTTVEEQVEAAKQALESEGYEIRQTVADAPNRFAISETEFHFTKQDEKDHTHLGTVSVFKHGDRVYRVTVHYPEDWEEGFIPRVVKMFDDIMWYDETP